MTMIMRHVIKCKHSGLAIGNLEVATTAGCLPYISHWDKCIAYHPVFSMSTEKLLKFTRDEWSRLAQRAEDTEISKDESDILCVSYLAVLHSLDCIQQEAPGLPALHVVTSTIQKLFNLAYWKWHLESQRFSFPTLRVTKLNSNLDFANINDYLELCFEIRSDYEKKVREIDDAEKIRSAKAALIMLNNSWVTPTNRRTLWRWVVANLPDKYKPDGEGWLATLFLGSNTAICSFEEDDIQLAEEIIVSSCPPGTGVMYAVRKRLDVIEQVWKNHFSVFEIDIEDFADNAGLLVNGEKVAAEKPGEEPKLADFPGSSKAKYYVAHAKWVIAMAAWVKENPQ